MIKINRSNLRRSNGVRSLFLTHSCASDRLCFMARPLRIEFDGTLYHVTSRGNARAPIFIADTNRVLVKSVEKYSYSQKEVADYLGLHYSTISRLLKKNHL